jgi:hypothetical protein
MYSLWLLSAVLMAAFLYAVRQIRRFDGLEQCAVMTSAPQTPVHDALVSEPSGVQTRTMKWISLGEFTKVLNERSDLIVIDLRADSPWVPFPASSALVLPVRPDELAQVLDMLPPDRSAAFCGASNLSIFLIETSTCMEGSAPLYVLEDDPGFAEVA